MKHVLLLLLITLQGCGGVQARFMNLPPVSGIPGPAGTSCSVTSTSLGAIVECTDGTSATILNGSTGATGSQGIQGIQGIQGVAGQQGAQGVAGINGTDATPVIVVQFCPSIPSSSYPEQGFCIGGQLYAEWYLPPNSGLVLLPPGNYASTQANGCNFTVVQGCQIQ